MNKPLFFTALILIIVITVFAGFSQVKSEIEGYNYKAESNSFLTTQTKSETDETSNTKDEHNLSEDEKAAKEYLEKNKYTFSFWGLLYVVGGIFVIIAIVKAMRQNPKE